MSSTAATSRTTDPAARSHAERKRAEKRVAAEGIGVDTAYIDGFVEAFYAKVRDDDLLRPIFADRIADWPRHLGRMKAFWRSVLHNSGEFSGNPMIKHLAIPGLDVSHFSRWLDLFYATLREAEPTSEATALVGERARMIADSLLTGIAMHRDGLPAGRAGKDLPHV